MDDATATAEPSPGSGARPLTDDERATLEGATRLRVLQDAGMLGDPLAARSIALDHICELVTRSMRVPTAHVSIVTAQDQRYAGAKNIAPRLEEVGSVGLEYSFCKHVAVDRRELVVEDATTHPLTAGSPAIEAFGARSYAGMPLITPDGESLGALCAIDTEPHHWSSEDLDTLRTLAEWVVMEVEMRRRLHELERADRLKDDLVAMVTHELRNPIASVVGSAKLLHAAWDDLDPDQRRRLVELMDRHGGRVGRLVEDLQLALRIDAGAVELEVEEIQVAAVVARAVEDVGLRVEVLDGGDELVARGDAGRVEQVLVNLLTNADKYGEPPIRVRCERRLDEVHVRVEDSGAGVPGDFAEALFERFTRAPGTARRPGSGLGLMISRGFARQMGGDLRYEPPSSESGPAFVLVLPAAGTA